MNRTNMSRLILCAAALLSGVHDLSATIVYSGDTSTRTAILLDNSEPTGDAVKDKGKVGPGSIDLVATHGSGHAQLTTGPHSGHAAASAWSDRAYGGAWAEAAFSTDRPLRFILATSNLGSVRIGSGFYGGAQEFVLPDAGFVSANVGFISPGLGSAVVVWGEGRVKGEDPTDPVHPRDTDDDGENDRVLDPQSITGVYLVGNNPYAIADIPVVGSYGHSDFIYTEVLDAGAPRSADLPVNFVSSNAFVAMTLPLGFGGNEQFQVHFGTFTLPIISGESVDFASFVPGGVHSFQITSIASGEEVSFGTFPEVIGLRFAGEGVTHIVLATPVPEPSTFALAALGVAGLMFMRKRRAAMPNA